MNAETPSSLFADRQRPPSRKGMKGNRNKLAQRYFEDMYAAWEEQGPSVIARAMFHDPVAVLGIIARLMPQKIEVSTPIDGLADEMLEQMLEVARNMAEAGLLPAVEPMQPARITSMRDDIVDHEKPREPVVQKGVVGGRMDLVFGAEGSTSSAQHRPVGEDAPSEATSFLAGEPIPSDVTSEKTTSFLDAQDPDLSEATSEKANLPYPVGRPFPQSDHIVEQANKAKLAAAEDDVDPASLF